jgi:phenylacetate-CoA ligase
MRSASSHYPIPPTERDDRSVLAVRQGRRLGELLAAIYGRNLFYTRKLDDAGLGQRVGSLRLPDELVALPLTTKAELVADQEVHPPWGTVLTEPAERYTRYNQTSSTTGRPLRWADTNGSWQWMLECWKAVYRAAHVGSDDRILFAFSFGPFLGFWTAFDAAVQLGAHAIPAGGMSSQQRLALIEAIEPDVVCCTPTYALRLAEVAAERSGSPPLSASSVRALIVAGEPGGSIPATRERIEESWGARVIDQHGLTEVGPVSFECWEGPRALHVNESEFICEVLDPATTRAVPDGQPGELVITNLGRTASPVIRYRTGDVVVRRRDPCVCGRTFARLDGGILARTDDMVNIRGVNVYPTAIESVVRQFSEVVEFRSTVSHGGALRRLLLEIEISAAGDAARDLAGELARRLREALGLNVDVHVAARGSLPRFEMKAHRFVVVDQQDRINLSLSRGPEDHQGTL